MDLHRFVLGVYAVNRSKGKLGRQMSADVLRCPDFPCFRVVLH